MTKLTGNKKLAMFFLIGFFALLINDISYPREKIDAAIENVAEVGFKYGLSGFLSGSTTPKLSKRKKRQIGAAMEDLMALDTGNLYVNALKLKFVEMHHYRALGGITVTNPAITFLQIFLLAGAVWFWFETPKMKKEEESLAS